MEQLFKGLFDTDMTAVIGVQEFLLCVGFALVLVALWGRRYEKTK